MPVNKNAMTRYKILDELLSSRYHNYSLDDLTEEVNSRLVKMYPESNGVVRRTIEKDISYLEYEGPFLVEIERYTVLGYDSIKQKSVSKQCLRYATLGFSIFKKEMTTDEEYLLREALSLLGQFDGLPNLEALESLRLGLGVKQDERKIISFTHNPLENTNLLGELFTAISQQQVVEIHYHKFGTPNNIQTIKIHPYLLKEYNRRWFVVGAAEDGGRIMCYSLDRINKVIPLPSHSYQSYNGDINEYFEDIIGVTNYSNKEAYSILFWVSDQSKDYVLSKPLHDSQKHYTGTSCSKYRNLYPNLMGGDFFSIECKENYELIRELTSFGADLIVLSPDFICTEIRKWITNMQKVYTSPNSTNIEFVDNL